MRFSGVTNLAVIACPGGAHFADATIENLKKIYCKQFKKKAKQLSELYNIDRKELIKRINFYSDLTSSGMHHRKSIGKIRIPPFKVNAKFTCFANGEFKTEIHECIRGKNVFIFQDVENRYPVEINNGEKRAFSVNDHLMSLLVTIDAVRHAGAAEITLVLPAYPYSRQHKKKGREGLTASMLGHFYESQGVKQIVTLDIHSREIENAFNTARIENLHASYQIINQLGKLHLLSHNADDLVVVAPDSGAVDRNKFYATGLKRPLAMIYKERDYAKVSENAKDSNIVAINLLGNVKDKTVLLADDMIGTGGTLLKAMAFLKEKGAKKVIAAVSLPFFSGSAIEDFDKAYREGLFYRIIGTNAVYHEELLTKEWFLSTDVSDLFARTISCIHHKHSLSSLLDNREIIDLLVQRHTRKD